jgi:hypothetical protein
MHFKPLAVLSLGVVALIVLRLSVVLHTSMFLSFAVAARPAKPPTFECPSKIARLVVVEATYLRCFATM